MKNKFIRYTIPFLALTAMLGLAGCEKDFSDPSRATEDKVFSSPKGLAGVVTGLQRTYTTSRYGNLYNLVTTNGLLTNELIVVNTGNTEEVQLSAGGNIVDGNNTMITTYWTVNNKVIYVANQAIQSAKNLTDKNFASGVIAYASIFKALSLGNLAQFWTHVPDTTGNNVTFSDRTEGFKRAVRVLEEAKATIAANPISATFTSSVPAGIDIPNTLNALIARFNLYAGQYAQALTAANLVDLSKKSTFNYDATSLNPLFEVATSTNNVVQPKDSTFGLPAALAPIPGDGRVPFYTSINSTIQPRFRISGFGATSTVAFPVYLPSEITLIKAEVYARTNDSTQAKVLLNSVITKTAGSDPFGIGANQPARNSFGSYDALLTEIYRQRSIELFMSGQRLEDMRRFNRPDTEMKRKFLPFPLRERQNNPNTPTDPAF